MHQHRTRHDQPESINKPHLLDIMQRISEDSIELDELVESLQPFPDAVAKVTSIAKQAAEGHRHHQEIRSLKHAIILLGRNRIISLLDECQPALSVRRPA